MSETIVILSTDERTKSLSSTHLSDATTSDPSIVADIPNSIGIGVTDGNTGDDVNRQAISGIEEMTGLSTSSLCWQSPFPHGLPPELLVVIFLEYARDDASFRGSTTVPRCMAISYICQYWRNVALCCANLWATHLFFVSSEWMDELLKRLNNVPLIAHIDLHGSGSRVGPIRSLEKTLGNMECIQDLWIDCPGD